MTPHHPLRAAWARAMIGAVALAGTPAHSQTPPHSSQFTTVNLNYVYAADLGFGGYALNGLTADVYTLPLAERLPDVPYPGWALKLLFPVQGGLYSFRATASNGERISINQQSLSLVPGAELDIPIGARTVLKPFAKFGVVHGFGEDIGNPDSWVYLGGVRAVTQWHEGATTFSLGNGIVYAGDSTIGPGFSEHYVSLQVGGEVRHPLGFKIGTFAPDIGVYAADYYYPTPLEFSRFLNPLCGSAIRPRSVFPLARRPRSRCCGCPTRASARASCSAAAWMSGTSISAFRFSRPGPIAAPFPNRPPDTPARSTPRAPGGRGRGRPPSHRS